MKYSEWNIQKTQLRPYTLLQWLVHKKHNEIVKFNTMWQNLTETNRNGSMAPYGSAFRSALASNSPFSMHLFICIGPKEKWMILLPLSQVPRYVTQVYPPQQFSTHSLRIYYAHFYGSLRNSQTSILMPANIKVWQLLSWMSCPIRTDLFALIRNDATKIHCTVKMGALVLRYLNVTPVYGACNAKHSFE